MSSMLDERRQTAALESIAKSLSALAEDTKAKNEIQLNLLEKMNTLENMLQEIKEDPFGLNERDSEEHKKE